MKKMVNITLPHMWTFHSLIGALVDLKTSYPHYFRENVRLHGVYGGIPAAAFNGGEYQRGCFTLDNMKELANHYHQLGVHMYCDFSNTLLESQHMPDLVSNRALSCLDKATDGVIVHSPILREYLGEAYEGLPIILSDTLGEYAIDELETTAGQTQVIVPFSMNTNSDLLQVKNKSKMFLIAASPCADSCEYADMCQNLHSMENKFDLRTPPFRCPHLSDEFGGYYLSTAKRANTLSIADINETYAPAGFQNYFLKSRLNPVDYIETIVNYFPKEEYQGHVRNVLLKELDISW